MIITHEFERADKLIKHAEKLKGINHAILSHRKDLICENKNDYLKAKEYMQHAYENSWIQDQREFLKAELDRVKSKLPKKKK